MSNQVFSEVFAGCPLPLGGENTVVKALRLDEASMNLQVDAFDPLCQVTPEWVSLAELRLRDFFGLECVTLRVDNMAVKTVKVAQKYLYGKAHSGTECSLDELEFATGKVSAAGQVAFVQEKIYRRGYDDDLFFSFALESPAGSVRVERKYPPDLAPKLHEQLTERRKKGLFVRVSGKMQSYSRQDGSVETTLHPTAISDSPSPAPREDSAELTRVELHLHTQMSEKDATTDVSQAISTAARWGHPAVAITDHGVCHSFPDAMKAAKKAAKAGTPIKILYGCEGYLRSDTRRNFHIILLAATQTGLKNLYRLVSLSHIEHYNRRPLLPRELLEEYREGLIIGSACEAGELFRAVVAQKPQEELARIASFYDYLEIQPVCNNRFLIREGLAADEQQLQSFNRTVVELGKALSKPVCATGDVHFLDPEHEIYRKILLSSMSMDHEQPLPLYFKTTEEMLEEFSYLGTDTAFDVVVTQPRAIADRCEELSPVRAGEYFPRIEGSAEELRRLSETRAHELYGKELPPLLAERLETELGSIIRKGYDIIYMIAQKLVQRSLAEGYLVGSRGSVGSSIVAYLAGITEVNALPPHYRCPKCAFWQFADDPPTACGVDLPDQNCPSCGVKMDKDGFDISFATFLGFDADKKPDIDLNFSGEYQARAHAHTIELFGESKVFRAGTITTLKDKNAVGYARKYLGDTVASRTELDRLARGCIGVRTTTGQHPGGLIVLPEDNEIYDFCPVQYPANKSENMITTHFDYHAIEENLLKLDLLGHDDPTMLRVLEDLTGIPALGVPLDDPDTMSLFTSSKVLGFENDRLLGPTGAVAVPEFGTRFVRGMLQSTCPTSFEELVRISGLSHGTDVWMGNAEALISAGTATLKQVICARDDIMAYLIGKGMERKLAFTIMESVRKGKGLKPDWEKAMRACDVPAWYMESCHKIKYMFPRAHAVAYVQMALRIAWFKVHRPLAFYAAFFTIRAVQFEAGVCTSGPDVVLRRIQTIEKNKDATDAEKNQVTTLEVCYEFYKRGFSFAPLTLMHSHSKQFLVEGDTLIPPLSTVPGLGDVAAEDLVRQRELAYFDSVEDIQFRCKVNRANLDALRALGALGSLPESAQISLF